MRIMGECLSGVYICIVIESLLMNLYMYIFYILLIYIVNEIIVCRDFFCLSDVRGNNLMLYF